MKKWYCVILCMLMGALAVSGQTADVGSTATVTEGSTVIEKNDTASALDAAEKDRAAPLPADAETSDTAVTEPDVDILPAAEPAANTVSEDTQAETVLNTDGSTESVSSPSASINEAGDAADTTTVISTGKDRDETQEQKDILQPVEMNEPTQRTKQRPLSMHSGLMIAVTGANNVFSFFDFFKPQLVVDFNKLSQKTIRSGIHAGVLVNFDWFFQFTVLGYGTWRAHGKIFNNS